MSAPTSNTLDVLARLADVIESRKGGDPDKSYVARLFHKGTDTILKKVGEEATEAVIAAKDMAAHRCQPKGPSGRVGRFVVPFHGGHVSFGLEPSGCGGRTGSPRGLVWAGRICLAHSEIGQNTIWQDIC